MQRNVNGAWTVRDREVSLHAQRPIHLPGWTGVGTTLPPELQTLSTQNQTSLPVLSSSMRAREAVAARGRIAAASQAATHAACEYYRLRELRKYCQKTPEELAADAARDKHDMLTHVAASQQATHKRANNRALRGNKSSSNEIKRREQEKQQKTRWKCAATMKPFASWRYAATCAQLPSLCVESGAHVCCFRSQLYVNGEWTRLFGRAGERGQPAVTTQSVPSFV